MNVAAHNEPTPKPRPAVGLNIMQILRTRGLSASELARYLKVHRSYMSRMLSGQNSIDAQLPKISEYLSVPIEQLESNGQPIAQQEAIMLPWGELDEHGRGDVPRGCIIKRIDRNVDAPRNVGTYVMLAPTSQKPKNGSLVYCALLNGDVFVRHYTANSTDPELFMLQPNNHTDSVVAVNVSKVHELRVVAIRNLFANAPTKE